MVLVNEAKGYRVCLECHEVLENGDQRAWMTAHAECADAATVTA